MLPVFKLMFDTIFLLYHLEQLCVRQITDNNLECHYTGLRIVYNSLLLKNYIKRRDSIIIKTVYNIL